MVLSGNKAALINSFPEALSNCSRFTNWFLVSLLSNKDFSHRLTAFQIDKVFFSDVTGGKGTISSIYRCQIFFKFFQENIDVVLKTSDATKFLRAFDEAENGDKKAIIEIHNLECEFYETNAPTLDFPLPQIYGTLRCDEKGTPGVILMESFCGKAETVPLSIGFNKHQLFNIAKHLASLHKHFLCLPAEGWRGKYDSSANIVKKLVNTNFFSANLEKLRTMKPGQFDKGVDLFLPYGKSKEFISFGVKDSYKEAGLPSVLVHGDFWCNNILWKTHPDHSISNEILAVVDWQMFDEGSPVRDITRALVMCTDAEIRREHQFEVLTCYYDSLVNLMAAEGRKVEFVLEQVNEAYKSTFIFQAMFIMCLSPYLECLDQDEGEKKVLANYRREKFLLRAQFAMEEAMELLEELPLNRFKNNSKY